MNVNIIAAMGQNRVIGNENQIPWHLSGDLKHFRYMTEGHVVLMGRKTFESIGKPLPNRTNIIISRTGIPNRARLTGATSIMLAHNLTLAMYQARLLAHQKRCNLFVIGGAAIYDRVLKDHVVDYIHLTEIQRDFEGDAYFPEIDSKKFYLDLTTNDMVENDLTYRFNVYKKRDQA